VVLRWKNAGREQEGSEEDRLFKLGHLRFDAGFWWRGYPLGIARENTLRGSHCLAMR
jgi:hypothetical protein